MNFKLVHSAFRLAEDFEIALLNFLLDEGPEIDVAAIQAAKKLLDCYCSYD